MITYEDYTNALIINKSSIPEDSFPAYAEEAERLINQMVTQHPIPDKYIAFVKATACRLCSQLYADQQAVSPTGQIITSKSETSGDYSYKETYDIAVKESGSDKTYQKIITDGLMWCNGEWTGLFYAGVNNRRCRVNNECGCYE